MTVVEPVARLRIDGSAPAERLVCHPRLPLVAGLDAAGPAVHIWDCGAGQLHALELIGAESTAYGDRRTRRPAVAWHPDQPLLVVSDERGVVRWTPDGLSDVEEVPSTASYLSLAFTSDGPTLWATPSSSPELEPWQDASDTLDLDSGAVRTGPDWNIGVAVHPAGGLVATLQGDDIDETILIFARVDDETVPARMRLLSAALDLGVDLYEAPIFSADGRHLAIRSRNTDSLEVFGFPSLRRVLKTKLDGRRWRDRLRHDIAFGAQPDVLWLGTPAGVLEELDLHEQNTVEHDVLDGHAVTALAATPAGELVVAHAGGELVLLSVLPDPATARPPDADAVRATVTAFLDATYEVPDDEDMYEHLVPDTVASRSPE